MCDHYPKIAVLLATYEGEKYLLSQLNSIYYQSYKNIEIWASDDGSEDNTYSILENFKYQFDPNRFFIFHGPKKGFAINFLSLLRNTNHNAEFYAYSDQDDIWEKDKITRAMTKLIEVQKDIPALYCSRTILVDENNKKIGFSPLFKKKPSFANALVQNIGGGNTMVFNNRARELICKINNMNIISHDWLTYMVVIGAGGKVFYDPYPSVRYRQHDNNLMGMNTKWLNRYTRIKMLFGGVFRKWNDQNIKALNTIRHHLTQQNKKILDQFQFSRDSNLLSRLLYLKKAGIYRQTPLGNLGLFVAAIFKKM